MIPQKQLHFLRRFFQMGPKTAAWLFYHRLKKQLFIKRLRKKMGSQMPAYNLNSLHNFCQKILLDKEFISSLPDKFRSTESILALADKSCIPEITTLGYGAFTFSPLTIPWHQDFTSSEPSPASWQSNLFADIEMPSTNHHNQSTRYPDIKVPWELSRLQHFFALGLGYHHAQKRNDQEKMNRYSNAFVQQTTSWTTLNPFGYGVNWINPMEVAIRAINFVWAFHFFKDASNISNTFWQAFICKLHDHEQYLRHTWEVSQKPNNHYIADLVGHLYLCCFLGINPKKTVNKLIGQWKHQILPDGTSYEGSTQYHKLVTEMMMHFLLVCKHTTILLPASLEQTYARMKKFLSDCTDNGEAQTLIGDNDSGTLVAGLKIPIAINKTRGITTYPSFGLSILRAHNWHVTFRHPTYQPRQPSGHFHQDMLSITLSINNIPIIVDPGTYVYTANSTWRNNLRSTKSHNTFFLENALPMPQDLFQLNCLEHPLAKQADNNPEKITVQDWHRYYHDHGLIAHRSVTLTPKTSTLTIADWWEKITSEPKENCGQTTWALHFAPEITLEQENTTMWYVKRFQQRLAMITTTLEHVAIQGWVCPEYGLIIPGTTLTASYPRTDDKQSIIIKKLYVP